MSAANVLTARVAGQPWLLDEAAPFLRMSKRHLEGLCRAGKVKSFFTGRSRVIPDQVVRAIAENGLDGINEGELQSAV